MVIFDVFKIEAILVSSEILFEALVIWEAVFKEEEEKAEVFYKLAATSLFAYYYANVRFELKII